MKYHSVKCLIQLKILIISALLHYWSLLSNGQFSVGLGTGPITIPFSLLPFCHGQDTERRLQDTGRRPARGLDRLGTAFVVRGHGPWDGCISWVLFALEIEIKHWFVRGSLLMLFAYHLEEIYSKTQTRTFNLQDYYMVMFGEKMVKVVITVLVFFVSMISTLNTKLAHFLTNLSDLGAQESWAPHWKTHTGFKICVILGWEDTFTIYKLCKLGPFNFTFPNLSFLLVKWWSSFLLPWENQHCSVVTKT